MVLGVAAVDVLDQLGRVDRLGDRLPELDVLEVRVAVADRYVRVGRRAGVDDHVDEPAALALVRRDVLGVLQRVELRRGEVVQQIDVTLDQRGLGGVDVVELDVLQLVDLGRAAPVVLVRRQLDVLALLVVGEDERSVADDRVAGGGVVGELADVGDALPHVLRHDRHVQREHGGLRLLGGDHQRVVVGRADLGEVGHEVAVRGGRVGIGHHQVEGERRVLGRHRLSVGPLDVVPDVERPGQAVRRVRPAVGQRGHRGLRLLVVGGQELVHHPADVRAGREHRGERVQGVDVLGQPHLQHGGCVRVRDL